MENYIQELFRYVNGEKRFFEISSNQIIAQFDEKLTYDDIKNLLEKETSLQMSGIEGTNYKKFKLVSFTGMNKEAITKFIEQQKGNDKAILFRSYVFTDEKGKDLSALTDTVIVRLKKERDLLVLKDAVVKYKIDTVSQCEFDSLTYSLIVNYSSNKNAMKIANELNETGLFDYVEPDLLLFIKNQTNDTYFGDQWGLKNIGQYGGTSGIDIKAENAWTITTGSSSIKIAILDTGVDLGHPDLISNLVTGYDVTGGGNNGNHSGDPHGTACAGIAAAQGNNSAGIAGVAYNCKITSIYHGGSATATQMANGIAWAITNNVKVISMSFSMTETTTFNTALSTAVSAGCILVASAGNTYLASPLAVRYPASHPDVIAVGACSPCGTRKRSAWEVSLLGTSCDTETHWGSNFGENLDVVAPGVLIPTTDIRGNDGYNPYEPIHLEMGGSKISADYANKDYTVWFTGTSAAAPHVAGIAALILSVYPKLNPTQVRWAIESTCQKINPYHVLTNPLGYIYSTNPNHPNGTWNEQVGHGLVDAYSAINKIPTIPRTINLGFHYLTGPTGVEATCQGDGFLGNPSMFPGQTQNYQVTSFTGAFISQSISVHNDYRIDLEEEPRGDYVLTGEGTSFLFVTYSIYHLGATVNSLILKFSTRLK
ncbi:MAG: S8 family serine peptidase [Prevotellaceae bacterium]|jgi:subtilisin family serine protease|nr:S8 family serine peptidase [Prevotellaceae bacterium]